MNCIRYRKGTYKYQLRATHVQKLKSGPAISVTTDWISFTQDGLLTIASGYAWDGASGPTWDSKSSMRGSLVHDALYQLMRMGLLPEWWRPFSDGEFRRICIEDGMFKWRANAWHWAVTNFAGDAAKANTEPEDLCAPCDCT